MVGDVAVRRQAQVLVFDADDTLWENNLVFERVIDDFLAWLDHPNFDRVEIRAILNDIERANTVAHGYRDAGQCSGLQAGVKARAGRAAKARAVP